MTSFVFGAATDVGRVRSVNEDRLYADGSVFAVADGMGGHHGGEVAAQIAVGALEERGPLDTLDDLVRIVHEANDRIVERARDEPELRGMGTTFCLLALLDGETADDRLGLANVGDSRVYRVVGDELEQISEDHSLVEALVRDGRLSPEEAGRHPQRNILTRALGIDAHVLVDSWELRAYAGDRYLVCTDGLFNEVPPSAIARTVTELDDPQEAAEKLVDAACRAGGRDNVTAVVVHLADAEPPDDEHDDRVIVVRPAVPDDDLDDDPDVDSDETAGSETETDPDPDRPAELVDPLAPVEHDPDSRRRSRWRPTGWRTPLLLVAVAIVILLAVTVVAAYARSSYYVGVDGDDVVIFQGRPGGILWFEPTREEPVNLAVSELDTPELERVMAGVEFDDLTGARDFARDLAVRARTGD